MRNENVILDRVSLKLERGVKQWYTDKSATYGMPMAVYMQYILTQFYENQMNSEAVRNLSALNSDGDLKDTNKQLFEILQLLNEKQTNEEEK
jgi:hypothetical protein